MNVTEMSKFWHAEWERALIENPLPILEQDEHSQIKMWDDIAKIYQDDALGMGDDRIKEVIDIIKMLKLVTKDSTVLDMGCGNGAYTLPFANMCKNVEAVDFSMEMLCALQMRVKQEAISNIQITKSNFEQFVDNAKREKKTYDLVFASLNPGLYSGDSILKMSELSSGSCIYIAPSQIFNQVEKALEYLLVKPIDILTRGSNVIYPFNMLYYMGCHPQIFYAHYKATKRETKEKMIERLMKYFSEKDTKVSNVEEIIVRYVEDRVKDGIFEDKTIGLMGVLIWQP